MYMFNHSLSKKLIPSLLLSTHHQQQQLVLPKHIIGLNGFVHAQRPLDQLMLTELPNEQSTHHFRKRNSHFEASMYFQNRLYFLVMERSSNCCSSP